MMKVLHENSEVVIFETIIEEVKIITLYYQKTGDTEVALSGLFKLLGYDSIQQMISDNRFLDMVTRLQKANGDQTFPILNGKFLLFRKQFMEKFGSDFEKFQEVMSYR